MGAYLLVTDTGYEVLTLSDGAHPNLYSIPDLMRPLEDEPPPDSFDPEALKQALLQGREALRQRYYGHGNGAALLRCHSRLLDDYSSSCLARDGDARFYCLACRGWLRPAAAFSFLGH